jgi:hypothetical protein
VTKPAIAQCEGAFIARLAIASALGQPDREAREGHRRHHPDRGQAPLPGDVRDRREPHEADRHGEVEHPLKRHRGRAAVDPIDERCDGHPHGIVGRHADEAGPEHPHAEGRKRDQPGDEFHAAGELRQRCRPDRGPERREEDEPQGFHESRVYPATQCARCDGDRLR